MSMITPLIVQKIVTRLALEMQTNVPSGDPTRVVNLKAYRFQESPLENNIYLWVTGGNPGDPNLRDGRISATEMDSLRMNIPVGEIGGGHYWWRRGRILLGCYFVIDQYDQDTAADYAHKVLGRALYYTEQVNVSDLVDDFGERGYGNVIVFASSFLEGGGPVNQYLWRGQIYWQALTHRPL